MIIFWAVSTIRRRIEAKRKAHILQEGVEASATVLNIAPTGEYLNNLPEFQVKVKIQPETGEGFVAEVKEILPYSKYDAMRQGSQIIVKYDPEYYRRVIVLPRAETLLNN
jgi:hypothetical protein